MLTHMGQNIGDLENFDDAGLQFSDEEDNGKNYSSKKTTGKITFS